MVEEELDPTVRDKFAVASEMRFVGIRLRHMREALTSTTKWAHDTRDVLANTERRLLRKAKNLDGIDVEA